MMLVSTKDYKYIGFENGYHVFRSRREDAEIRTRVCKLFDVASHATYIYLEDGRVETTYNTTRKAERVQA